MKVFLGFSLLTEQPPPIIFSYKKVSKFSVLRTSEFLFHFPENMPEIVRSIDKFETLPLNGYSIALKVIRDLCRCKQDIGSAVFYFFFWQWRGL